MKNKIKFAGEFWTANIHAIWNRIYAVFQSVMFRPADLANYHFHRYTNYKRIENLIAETHLDKGVRIIEFGGSNGVIAQMFKPQYEVEVAPNYPEVDIQSLSDYENHCCDIIILDQILEHIPAPRTAVEECFRILRPNGICISTTPFLIQIHGYPNDYHRFTESGLKELFSQFDSVEINSWGNRLTLETFHRYGWLSAKNARLVGRAALWNEEMWPIDFLVWAIK